jgi:hypothetical protein
LQNVTLTCLKVLVDEKCDDIPTSFKNEVGNFVKNVLMASGEASLNLLRDLENKMSEEEKESLRKFVPF